MGSRRVRILFSSHVFAPSIGGLEKVSGVLATEFVRQGHEVRVVTQTPGDAASDLPFAVIRRPTSAQLLALVRWCDVFFHNNISLPKAWPLLFVRRPWVVAHHVWIPRAGLAARMKRYALRHACGVAISHAVAAHLDTPSEVIPNPYDDAQFRRVAGVARNRDLVFLGRLVSDKGVNVLLAALMRLKARGLRPTVTIIGSGDEAPALQASTVALGLADLVTFAGAREGEELVRLLNEHRILVVPSLWQEPFGIVALEGMACGCVPVGSAGGGLKDAIGDCGETFPNGDAVALAHVLERLLGDPHRQQVFRERSVRHLRRHEAAAVAAEYLRVLQRGVDATDGRHRKRDVARV